MQKEQAVYNILENLAIPFSIEKEALSQYTRCKTVFMNDHQTNQAFLVVTPHHKPIDSLKSNEQLGLDPLDPTRECHILEHLKLHIDEVSPFSLIYDLNRDIQLLIDKELLQVNTLFFQANVNHTHICIQSKDFQNYLDWLPNKSEIIDL